MGRPGCHTPTVHVSHLPVGDVHLLVVTRRKGESHRITPCEDPISIRLHHLGERLKDEMNEGNRLIRPAAASQHTLLTVMKPLESVWMPLCFRKPVAGTLPAAQGQESYQPHTYGPLGITLLTAYSCLKTSVFKCVQPEKGESFEGHFMSPAPMTQTSARRTLPLFSTTSFSCGKRTRCVGALF